MVKSIGCARVSTRAQDTDWQAADLLEVGVRCDDLNVDHGVSGARASRPGFDRALAALPVGDVLVIATLDRLGCLTANMLGLAERLRGTGVALKVLNLGGGAVDTRTPAGSMLLAVMAALAQLELDVKSERINDFVSKRRAAGLDRGGRREKFTRRQLGSACKLIDRGKPATQVARDLGISRATLYRRLRSLRN